MRGPEKTHNRPPGASRSKRLRSKRTLGVHGMTTSAPRPFVPSLTISARSSPLGCDTRSKSNFGTCSKRSRTGSLSMTLLAPRLLAKKALRHPIGPPPRIRTESPSPTRSFSWALTQQARGSAKVIITGSAFPIGTNLDGSATVIISAMPPSVLNPIILT
ncbi:hypothetical protein DSECCO2_389920 [anaerobic digester metagenome]